MGAAAVALEPPARLAPDGVRAVLGEAIERARETDSLGSLRAAVEQPGLRRRLLARFATWTSMERSPHGPPPGNGPVEVAEWALFGHFAATLADIHAQTPAGWATWAARVLVENPLSGWRNLADTFVALVEPVAPTPAVRRVVEHWAARAGGVVVSLPFDPDPALGEVYAAVEPTRRFFLGLGFAEESIPNEPGLTGLDRELFRADAHQRPPLADDGMRILGGPKGDGQALLIAREVRAALQAGTSPDEILILVPREDEDVATIRAVLASWEIPVAPGPTGRLATNPAVAALRLVLGLTVREWEVATFTRLLRHGAVGWDRLGLSNPFARFEVAAVLTATRVYRDRDRLRAALERRSGDAKPPAPKPHLDAARTTIDNLAALVDPVTRPGAWRVHLVRLQTLAGQLGLDDVPLAPLWDAVEDHAWVLDQLGPALAAEVLDWPDFVGAIERIITEAEPLTPSAGDAVGTVRVAAVGTVDAARADLVILANLAEKSFPAPGSVPLEPTPTEQPGLFDLDPADSSGADRSTDLSYSRELLRFTRAVAAANSALILTYPTTETTGESLLPAGFLDEILRRLDPESLARVERSARFDPVLRGCEDLAKATGDARVLAVAEACAGNFGPLGDLAAQPDHATALRGVAEAFRVGHARRERTDFNQYDGWLMDTEAIAQIAVKLGPEHSFSPSQLESFAYCPFQFFARYVLGLKLTDAAEELAEDYAERGREVHEVLEEVHQTLKDTGSTDLLGDLTIHINDYMGVELAKYDDATPADVAEVLREINTRRTGRALDRYLNQFRKYSVKHGVGAVPDRFEVKFGQPDKPGSLDHLILGTGETQIKVEGVIDRIDRVEKDGQSRFRVIDYKTGANPSQGDVKSGQASQLPLYAMAVEKLVLLEEGTEFLDAGYWSLSKEGFKPVKLDGWDGFREAVGEFVEAMVGKLRGGVFPIASQESKCTQFCDFHKTCRVGEVRRARKTWPDRPELEV